MQSIPASTCFRTVSAMAGVTCAAMAAGSVSSALASRAGMSSQPLGGGSRPTCEVLIRVRLFFIFPSSLCLYEIFVTTPIPETLRNRRLRAANSMRAAFVVACQTAVKSAA
jgi:hypothetical protein